MYLIVRYIALVLICYGGATTKSSVKARFPALTRLGTSFNHRKGLRFSAFLNLNHDHALMV